ncbi:hypothetical protein ASC80_17075 [Afipia sp. Root123D2]|nr:hypothetical protein ASC80_17075 [Afipia sp. Root123D2]
MEIVEHGVEVALQRGPTANYHIIMVGSHGYDVQALHQFAKPAAHTIAFGGGADFPGHGKTDPDRSGIVPVPGLYDKGWTGHAGTAGGGNKIRASSQPVHDINRRMEGVS